MPVAPKSTAESPDVNHDVRHAEALLKTGALQSAIFNSANFSSIGTDAKGVIQIFKNGYVASILEKAAFDSDRFMAEVRPAVAGRRPAA